MHEVLGSVFQHHIKLGMVPYTFNASTQEPSAGESEVQGQYSLLTDFETILGYLRLSLKKICLFIYIYILVV